MGNVEQMKQFISIRMRIQQQTTNNKKQQTTNKEINQDFFF